MNILLLTKDQMTSDARATLSSHQQKHISSVLKLKTGETLRVGQINGPLGEGRLLSDPDNLSNNCEIEIEWSKQAPPPALNLTVCVALPRPKALRRLLFALTVQGVKQIHVFHAYRVEKSYWTSPLLSEKSTTETFIKGLEQAGDTVLPSVHFHQRFRPFAEDDLPGIARGKKALVLDKRGEPLQDLRDSAPTCVVIGPEGGFIDFELELFKVNGFKVCTLGTRILTVELAAVSFASSFSQQ
ncbi:MAG: 16S rRNA (uracil(1498)-N(3))-methyltransferase [Bdellovibrionales bacterium]|nr:16S rRNA (uracil(1498)-N(3))-methyltransferase [Bdellovibrionales bacterium]